MKRFSRFLCVLSGSLVALIALVFIILEATLLVTLDFLLYENELVALLQLALKLLVAISALALGVASLVKGERAFFSESVCLLAASAVMIPFVSNGFGVYFTIVAALFAVSHLLFARGRR